MSSSSLNAATALAIRGYDSTHSQRFRMDAFMLMKYLLTLGILFVAWNTVGSEPCNGFITEGSYQEDFRWSTTSSPYQNICNVCSLSYSERNNNGCQATFCKVPDYMSRSGKLFSSDVSSTDSFFNSPACSTQESAMESGLELNDRFLFVESLRYACSYLGIDFQFITNNRNLDEFVHYFLKGERKYPTQLLVSEGSLNKCAQEFSSALETELTTNSITVNNTVASAYNLVKTSTDSTKIDISAVELAALNNSLKEQQLQETVISKDDFEADIASKQQEQLNLQLECEEASHALQEAEDELVQANKEVDDSQHANMLHNQSLQSMEMQLSSLNQQHTALLVASNTNSVETTRARADAAA